MIEFSTYPEDGSVERIWHVEVTVTPDGTPTLGAMTEVI